MNFSLREMREVVLFERVHQIYQKNEKKIKPWRIEGGRKSNRSIAPFESPHRRPECIYFFLNAISSILKKLRMLKLRVMHKFSRSQIFRTQMVIAQSQFTG